MQLEFLAWHSGETASGKVWMVWWASPSVHEACVGSDLDQTTLVFCVLCVVDVSPKVADA